MGCKHFHFHTGAVLLQPALDCSAQRRARAGEQRRPHKVQAARVLHKLERGEGLGDGRAAGLVRLAQAQLLPPKPVPRQQRSHCSGAHVCLRISHRVYESRGRVQNHSKLNLQ